MRALLAMVPVACLIVALWFLWVTIQGGFQLPMVILTIGWLAVGGIIVVETLKILRGDFN